MDMTVSDITSVTPSIGQIQALQEAMRAGPTIDLEVQHHFTDGATATRCHHTESTAAKGLERGWRANGGRVG